MRGLHRASGVALIAVLWMVAALGLAAHSLIGSLRGEIRHIGNERAALAAGATADAAILLTLQELQVQRVTQLGEVRSYRPRFHDIDVEVDVIPLAGWIDINNAPESLLVALFQHGGDLAPAQALLLAQAVKAFREQRGPGGRAQGFESSEDLLRVPGLDFDLYVKIQSLITAELSSGGRVNPLVAPEPVLEVVAGGNTALSGRIAAARGVAASSTDLTGLPPEHVDNGASSRVCLCARVLLPDGQVLHRRWRVVLGNNAATGLPWSIIGREQRLVAAPSL